METSGVGRQSQERWGRREREKARKFDERTKESNLLRLWDYRRPLISSSMYLQPLLYFVLKRAVLFLASDLICQDSAPDETLAPKICPFLSPLPAGRNGPALTDV